MTSKSNDGKTKTTSQQEALYEEKSFQWFLQQICLFPKLKINVPETLVFDKGKPVFFVYSNANNKLKFTTEIRIHEIISIFMRKVSKRKNPIKYSIQNYEKHTPVYKSFNKEIAILKSKTAPLQVLENTSFVNILLEKSFVSNWNDIVSIQSAIKTTFGIGKTITYPYCFENTDESIEGSIIKKISESFSSINIKLIQAKFDFLIDDDKNYWISYVEDIQIQNLKIETNSGHLSPIRMNPETRKNFLQSLDYHSSKPKSKRFVQIQKLMFEHYNTIKEKLKIDETLSKEFHLEVPEKTLPYMVENKKVKENSEFEVFATDFRNTARTIRRLSLFQASEFKNMKSPRVKGRKLFMS